MTCAAAQLWEKSKKSKVTQCQVRVSLYIYYLDEQEVSDSAIINGKWLKHAIIKEQYLLENL